FNECANAFAAISELFHEFKTLVEWDAERRVLLNVEPVWIACFRHDIVAAWKWRHVDTKWPQDARYPTVSRKERPARLYLPKAGTRRIEGELPITEKPGSANALTYFLRQTAITEIRSFAPLQNHCSHARILASSGCCKPSGSSTNNDDVGTTAVHRVLGDFT